jgi:hypothetical protein
MSALSPELQRKSARIAIVVAKRRRIERIRTALQNIIDQLERDREVRRRASCGGGEHPSQLLIDAICLSEDFNTLIEDL